MPALRTGAAALAACVLLSGCSQDPQPRIGTAPSPPATRAAPPTPSPSVTEPETPKAFIQRWFDVGFEMQRTGNTAEFDRLSSACQPCVSLAESVTTYYGAGGFVEPSPTRVEAVNQPQPEALDFYARTRTGRTTLKESANAELKQLRGGAATYLVRLEPAGGSWTVTDFFLEPAT